MIDAGSVLVESSCSVDRVDESLRTLLPLIPGRVGTFLTFFVVKTPIDDTRE
jgi:hypothetical protein